MPKYKAYITVNYLIRDIEADDETIAKRNATDDYDWDDHVLDCTIDVHPETKTSEKNDTTTELQVSDHEKAMLFSFYYTEGLDEFRKEHPDPFDKDGSLIEENFWIGVQVDERMFDLCIFWSDSKPNRPLCVVYECDPCDGDDGEPNGNWTTNTYKQWYLTDEMEVAI